MEDTERLIVALEGRFSKYERDFERARRTTDRQFSAIERRTEQASRRMESTMAQAASRMGTALKTIGAGFLGGVAGGLAVGGLDQIVSSVGRIAESVANVGSEAKRAGVSIKAFQELKFVAEQNRIGVDALVDGLKEMNLRADEFIITGKGPAAEAFARLGFGAEELKRKLADPSALLVEIIGRLQTLDKAAQIRIADELFGGTAGERFVELLDQGAEGIRRQIAEANRLGVVLDADVIARADEIDRKFKIISTTISTSVKEGVVLLVSAMAEWLDTLNEIEERQVRTLSNELADLGKRRVEIENQLLKLRREEADAQSGFNPFGVDNAQAIADLKEEAAALAETEARILRALSTRHRETGKAASEAAPQIDTLNSSLSNTGSAATTGSNGITTFAGAIRALREEVPALAEDLARLDKLSQINTHWRTSTMNARTMSEVMVANSLHAQASAAVRNQGATDAAERGFLDLIGHAEGTDKGRSYNESLGYGRFTGGSRNLVLMTLDEIDALQTQMLAHPDNGFNSSALGRFQITRTTLRGLRAELGLSGDELFSPELQDRAALQLMRRRGNDPAGLRNEWEGLRGVDDATIRAAYDRQSLNMPAVDPVVAERADFDRQATQDQIDAYGQIIASGKEFVSLQGLERQALDQTAVQASRLRIEHQMLAEAQRAGVTLSSAQRAEIGRLAGEMAVAEQATVRYAETQQQVGEMQRFFGQQAVDALSGLLTGTMTAEQALRQLLATLIKASLQAAILGEGPLAGLLSGGTGTGKTGAGGGAAKGIGSLFGAILGLASGGFVSGPGTATSDSIPAMLSDGEFVVRASQTAKHRALLEAINSGAPIAGFAAGGVVGKAGTLRATNQNTAAPVTINAPITVNGSAGTPEQNADLARKVAKQMEDTMRGVVADEMRRQTRPGNTWGRR